MRYTKDKYKRVPENDVICKNWIYYKPMPWHWSKNETTLHGSDLMRGICIKGVSIFLDILNILNSLNKAETGHINWFTNNSFF